MGSITTDDDVYGSFRYSLPSEKTPAYDRSLYSFPASEVVKDHQHKLHDIRTSTCIEKGGAGLDVQGFTHVKHESKLSGDEWFSGKNVEDVYAPEVIKLICEVTGANRAVVDGFAVRSRAATETENDPYDVKLRGNPMDLQVSKIPRNIIRVPGRDKANRLEPARVMHVDYNVQGLKDTVRYNRKDIKKAAQAAIDAEDAGGEPRYAVYSIWRPLKPVKRDPLVVLDWRSVNKSELAPIETRALSEIKSDGDYIRTGINHIPPGNPDALRWYWIANQQPDDVLILKFADTKAGEKGEKDGDVAAHCVHGSCVIAGTEEEEPRESIECRIIAFFD